MSDGARRAASCLAATTFGSAATIVANAGGNRRRDRRSSDARTRARRLRREKADERERAAERSDDRLELDAEATTTRLENERPVARLANELAPPDAEEALDGGGAGAVELCSGCVVHLSHDARRLEEDGDRRAAIDHPFEEAARPRFSLRVGVRAKDIFEGGGGAPNGDADLRLVERERPRDIEHGDPLAERVAYGGGVAKEAVVDGLEMGAPDDGDRLRFGDGRPDGVGASRPFVPARPFDEARAPHRVGEQPTAAGPDDDAVGVGEDREEAARGDLGLERVDDRGPFAEPIERGVAPRGEVLARDAEWVRRAVGVDAEVARASPPRDDEVRRDRGDERARNRSLFLESVPKPRLGLCQPQHVRFSPRNRAYRRHRAPQP